MVGERYFRLRLVYAGRRVAPLIAPRVDGMKKTDPYCPLYMRYGLKLGVACLLSYGISYLTGAEYALWAVVSTIVAMQINVAESLQAGLIRIGGTAVGAAVGVGLLLATPDTAPFLVASVFCITVFCGYLTRYSPLWSATSIAAVVVLLAGSQHLDAGGADAASFGLMRVVEIAIGVGCAFFVSLVLWPVRLMDTLRADLSLQFLEGARLLDTLLESFRSGETQPYTLLSGIEGKIWDNHERLNKAQKHESLLFHYEHAVMNVQVTMLDRTAESLRTMLEALNDYDEEVVDPIISPELRELGDAIMAALRHLGGSDPTAAAPDLVRGLTSGVGKAELTLALARQDGRVAAFNLHKTLQLFTFYQAMRQLAESLLIALDKLQRKAEAHGRA